MTVWHRMSTVVPSTTNYNWQHWCLDACQFSDIQHVLCSSFVDNKFTRSFLTTSHLGSSSLTTTCPSWASLSQPVILTWACPFQCVKWGNRGPTRPNETLRSFQHACVLVELVLYGPLGSAFRRNSPALKHLDRVPKPWAVPRFPFTTKPLLQMASRPPVVHWWKIIQAALPQLFHVECHYWHTEDSLRLQLFFCTTCGVVEF